MSALQSPMRVHGDNIYVRHSNLMLEVGTGVVWWLKIRTTCFCVLWRHQNCNFLYTELYKTAALSHSQALCACLRVCGCLFIKSIPAFSVFFFFPNYSMIENVFILKGFSANCPNSCGSYFEHKQGNLIENVVVNDISTSVSVHQQWIRWLIWKELPILMNLQLILQLTSALWSILASFRSSWSPASLLWFSLSVEEL